METPMIQYLPLLFKGAGLTLQVMGGAALLSLSMGLVLGILSSQRSRIPGVSTLVETLTFVLRSVPFYVQLLIVYFVFPELLGFNLEPFTASVLALGVCSSGYVAQIIRGGINNIPIAQWEAAFALGMTKFKTLRYVIFPQLIRLVLPSLNNELDSLLKTTSVVSSIGLLELTRMGMNIVSREMEPLPVYLTIAVFYLVMSAALNAVARFMERRLSYVRD